MVQMRDNFGSRAKLVAKGILGFGGNAVVSTILFVSDFCIFFLFWCSLCSVGVDIIARCKLARIGPESRYTLL